MGLFCFVLIKPGEKRGSNSGYLFPGRGLAEIISGQGSEEITMPSVCPGGQVNAHKCLEEFPCPWPHRTPSHPPLQPFLFTAISPAVAAGAGKPQAVPPQRPWRSHLLPSSLWPLAPEGEYSLPFFIVSRATIWPWTTAASPGSSPALLLLPPWRKRAGGPAWLGHQLGPTQDSRSLQITQTTSTNIRFINTSC